ncbi:MAG: PLP-dependent transferase [Spirochaetes bacterium]|nr:PLP-dependent transferase [Spirochaetota bacterium]
MKNIRKYGIKTEAVHSGTIEGEPTGAVMTPIYATSTFAQKSPGSHSGYEYSRSGNPTRNALETCLSDMENGSRGYAFSSGLAAENCIIDLLPKDSHVLIFQDLYGGTFRLFDKVRKISSGIEAEYISMDNADKIIERIRPNTRMIWVESPSNPMLKIVDLEMVAGIAAENNIISVCDSTFATPVIQKPLEFGFDIVVHSATKYLNGHSDVIAGGAVVRESGELADRLSFLQNATGAVLSPFDSFLVLRGIKTLPLRMEAHCRNAMSVAEFLQNNNRVEKVIYPGLSSHPDFELASKQMEMPGGMITFFIKGGLNESRMFLESLKVFTLAESLGGVESLAEHPAIMTHASIPPETRKHLGISDNLVRLSVGIEDSYDLIDDLDNALRSY